MISLSVWLMHEVMLIFTCCLKSCNLHFKESNHHQITSGLLASSSYNLQLFTMNLFSVWFMHEAMLIFSWCLKICNLHFMESTHHEITSVLVASSSYNLLLSTKYLPSKVLLMHETMLIFTWCLKICNLHFTKSTHHQITSGLLASASHCLPSKLLSLPLFS